MDFRRLTLTLIAAAGSQAAVAQAPAPATAAPPPQKSLASTLGVYVFPANGQAASQQSKDESACYDWSVKETGSDPFEVQKQEAAAKQQATQQEQQIAGAGKGAGAKGGLGGAAAGALIGEVSHGDVGESAAIGAAAGAIAGRRKAHQQQQAAAGQVEAQTQQAVQADEAKVAGFKKAFSACLEGKKYTVKY